MLTTTKGQLRDHHACEERYAFLCTWAPSGDEDPIPLEHILQHNGPDDAIWALRALDDDGGLTGWVARWCAAQVVHLWDAPEVIREYLRTGDASLRVAAGDEAKSASYAYAARSAFSAARDAADAARHTTRAAQSAAMRNAIARIRAGEPLGEIKC